MEQAIYAWMGDHSAMLTEIYTEALLVDKDLADLDRLIQIGKGNKPVAGARFRCKECGEVVERQVRPPVPEIGGNRNDCK